MILFLFNEKEIIYLKEQSIFLCAYFYLEIGNTDIRPGSFVYVVLILFLALTTPVVIDLWRETEQYVLILIFICSNFFLGKYAYDKTSNSSFQIHEQIRSLGL